VTRRRAVGWLSALVVLLIVLVAADRVSAMLASKTAERYLARQAAFAQPPKVQINGFPFLTQAISGRYDDVEVRDSAVELGGVPASNLIAHLHGVHLPLSDLFGGTVTSLPVDSASGSLTLSYPEVVRLSQIPMLAITDSDGQLHVSATLTIPGFGVSAPVTGVGRAQIVGGALQLTVTQLSVDGLTVPASVLDVLTHDLEVPITLPALPYGLHVTGVTPTATGIVIAGSATQVVISAG
jgi:hypothetical protein